MNHTATIARLLRHLFTILLLSFITLTVAAQATQDVLYFKNGNVIRGTILEQVPGETVRIRTADGNELVFQLSEIERITREEAQGGGATPEDAIVDNKKGFILALGAGFGRISGNDAKFGVMTDFKIGHAPSNQLMIYYANKVAWYSRFERSVIGSVGGIGATYFLKPDAPTFYVDGVIGLSSFGTSPFSSEESSSSSSTGFGFSLGGGYEFSRHWMADLDLMVGDTISSTLKLTVTWLLY